MEIGIVGYGNIGQALHQKYLANTKHHVFAFDVDQNKNAHPIDDPLLSEMDLIVCGAPASQTIKWAEYAVTHNQHFIGFTEDVDVTRHCAKIAISNKAMIPQCGLAPGMVNIIADSYARAFTNVSEIDIRVGALPRSTTSELRYAFTWSPEGVINEYRKGCEVILDGIRVTLPGMEGYEKLIIDGTEYEAFLTSGGIGSLCETYDGKAQRVVYKTVRYVGHRDVIGTNYLMERHFGKCPMLMTNDDIVVVHISVVGHNGDNKLQQLSFTKKVYGDQEFSAIQKTTAQGALIWIDAIEKSQNIVGYIRQEQYHDYGCTSIDEFLN
jgi:saccharopine dehydrogenase-like NADP-dependent oxidoreductase